MVRQCLSVAELFYRDGRAERETCEWANERNVKNQPARVVFESGLRLMKHWLLDWVLSLSLSLSVERCPIYTILLLLLYTPANTLTHTRQRPTHLNYLHSEFFFSSPCSLPNWIEKERRMCVCTYTAVGFWAFGYVIPSSVCVCVLAGLWGWWLADWADCCL